MPDTIVLTSAPVTFDPFPSGVTLGFDIPLGTWTSATWHAFGEVFSNDVMTVPPFPDGEIRLTTGGSHDVALPVFLSNSPIGTYSESAAASGAQMGDINAAAGGPLSVLHSSFVGFVLGVSISRLTLTIVGTVDPSLCSADIDPTSATYTSAGGSGAIDVDENYDSCQWTALSNESWIHITGGSSGTGDGTCSYSVDANASASSRIGTITLALQTFTVYQAGVPYGLFASEVDSGERDLRPHPHTHAISQFARLSYPNGYLTDVSLDGGLGALSRVLWQTLLCRDGTYNAVAAAGLVRVYLAGVELDFGDEAPDVDVWRFGF